MLSVFLELVKRVGIFIIIGQTILHFGISKKYEKYMKIVISFMVVAQIIFAFGVYQDQGEERGMFLSAEEYMKKWDLNMERTEVLMENNRSRMIQNLELELQQSEKSVAQKERIQGKNIQIEKVVIN